VDRKSFGCWTLTIDRKVNYFGQPGERCLGLLHEFMGTNDTSDRTVKYERWSAHPETRIPFGRLSTNPLGANATVVPITDRELPSSADSWKFGTRIIHNFGNLNTGLGYIWGYNPPGFRYGFQIGRFPVSLWPASVPPGRHAIAAQARQRSNEHLGRPF
jgi:hypothetical protein